MHLACRMLTTLAALCVTPWSTMAEPRDCRLAPDVIAAADVLLMDPKNDQRFWRDRLGDDAAYLKIRYGDLPSDAGLRLVEDLRQRARPPQRIDELRLSLLPPAQRRAAIEAADPAAAVTPGGISTLRALVTSGDGPWLFADMARRAAIAGARPEQATSIQLGLARGLADLDDTDKLRIAGEAEAEKLWPLARGLLSTRADLGPWLALLRRSPQNPASAEALTQQFAPLWRGYGRMGAPPLTRDALPEELRPLADAIDARRLPGSADVDAALALMMVAPRTHLLVTAINQTGEMRIGRDIAMPLLARIRSGQIDPHADDDRIRALVLAGTARILGTERMRQVFSSFQGSGDGSSGETALAALERSLVRHTLGAFARGEEAEPPRPQLLSPSFDWDGWRDAALAIRERRPAVAEQRGVEAALLHAMGRHAAAIGVLRRAGPTDDMRRRAHAMMVTLDQMCGGALWPHPLLGQPVYRFPPQPR